MITSPTCPTTHNRAILFCYEKSCFNCAFACTEDCLGEHTEHRRALWSGIERDIIQMTELTLSKEELLLLEKQEKQLKIVIEELKTIQDGHYKAIVNMKKRLKLKDAAEKVTLAIQSNKSSQVTGADMANLIN